MVHRLLAASLLAGILFCRQCVAYPMIIEVIEESERCINLNIPENDDAHIVFLALPSPTDEDTKTDWTEKSRKLEEYYVSKTHQLAKYRSSEGTIPRKYPDDPPEDIRKAMDEFLEDQGDESGKSGCRITVSNPQSSSSRVIDTFYFAPVVINNVRKAIRNRRDEWESSPLEGYSICFNNERDDAQAQIIMESVLVNGDRETDETKKGFQKEHLTPLAEQLQESIDAAETVLSEMKYMEKREKRMRVTADSINTRVRYFSYISVGVLLAVTYVQVTYLKRYFRKKKLL